MMTDDETVIKGRMLDHLRELGHEQREAAKRLTLFARIVNEKYGISWREIGWALGVDHTHVWRAVTEDKPLSVGHLEERSDDAPIPGAPQ